MRYLIKQYWKLIIIRVSRHNQNFLPWEVGATDWLVATVVVTLEKAVTADVVVVVVAAVEEVKLLWEGEELSGEENGSEKLERRERPADNSWHMADTASPGLVSTIGDISGMGVTVQNMYV